MGLLLWHLQPSVMFILSLIAIGLWLFNFGFRINHARFLSQNKYNVFTDLEGAIKIEVFGSRITKGYKDYNQYFNMYVSNKDRFLEHLVPLSRQNGVLEFLVEGTGKFQNYTGNNVKLDGPWGGDLRLERNKNVILAAKGIGIVGLLPCAFYLLEGMSLQPHENQGFQTRTLELHWLLEQRSQLRWVEQSLRNLQTLDKGNKMHLRCYIPDEIEEVWMEKLFNRENWELLRQCTELVLDFKQGDEKSAKSVVAGNHPQPFR